MIPRDPDLDRLAAEEVVHPGAAPAAVVGFATTHPLPPCSAAGAAGDAGGRPAEVATPFDLASVTKPVTALVAARLVERGALRWQLPLGAALPEARGTPSEAAPLLSLLCHRAGLDGHRPLHEPLLRGERVDPGRALATAASARRAEAAGAPPPGGFPPVYSDLGYLLVGALLERVTARPLDELAEDEVGRPLGLGFGSARRLAVRDPRFASAVAPTEEQPWRGGVIRGAVHDENAFALAGLGLAGHAGLFGRAEDVLGLGVALLDVLGGRRDTWLRSETLWELVRPRPGGTLRAGFDSPSAEGSSAGPAFGPDAFGHLGFTGTSLWCDPTSGVVVTLLTNRVHPTRANVAIRAVRPVVHGALHALALARARRSGPR